MKLPLDLIELLEAFADEGVEFAVVGGYAVAFHGRPRATKDLDLLVGGSNANLSRAAQALSRFGAPERVVSAVAGLAPNEIAYFGQPPLRVDTRGRESLSPAADGALVRAFDLSRCATPGVDRAHNSGSRSP